MRPINGAWKGNPGNFDPHHALDLQESNNDWGIPSIKCDIPVDRPDVWMPNRFIAYDDWRTARNKGKAPPQGLNAVHFFMDDYRFEPVWNNPGKALVYLDGASCVMTPDFSLYRDHPLSMQLWNTYRNRWIGAYWQGQGATVIPTVGWSTPASYQFAFLGLPKNGILAVATVGMGADPESKRLFNAGYEEMCRQLTPKQVLCYGETFPDVIRTLAPLQTYGAWHLKLRAIDERKKMGELPGRSTDNSRKLKATNEPNEPNCGMVNATPCDLPNLHDGDCIPFPDV